LSARLIATSHVYPEIVDYEDDRIDIKGSMKFHDPAEFVPLNRMHQVQDCLTFNGSLHRTPEQSAHNIFTESKELEGLARFQLEMSNNYRDFEQDCFRRKRFLGMDIDLNVQCPRPASVSKLYRKVRDSLVKRHFEHMSYDMEQKNEASKISISLKSSEDEETNDLTITDYHGTQIFKGFPSKVLPLMVRSSCPLKPHGFPSKKHIICGSKINHKQLTLSTQTYDDNQLTDTPVSKCGGVLTQYKSKDGSFSIQINSSSEGSVYVNYGSDSILLCPEAIKSEGETVTPEDGTISKVGPFFVGRSKADAALFAILPNEVVVAAFEPGHNQDDYFLLMKTPRIYKGSMEGLCGDMDGTPANDGRCV
jgi:hypothetical protein